ncbi:MAG TPA: response regulator [Candidatus Paceibacterota bacterium]
MEQTQTEKTVLIVEDNKSIRELYAMALTNEGLKVLMAEDGVIGLEFALTHHPDVILLDIDMPGMTGQSVGEELRKDEWGKTARIIFLTNRTDPQNQAHAAMLNPADYIVKAEVPVKDVVAQVKKTAV